MSTHPSLTYKVEEAVQPLIEVPPVDLSKVEAKAKHIIEQVNQIVSDAELELDSIEKRLELVILKRLEQEK
jgi:hypothetical protein